MDCFAFFAQARKRATQSRAGDDCPKFSTFQEFYPIVVAVVLRRGEGSTLFKSLRRASALRGCYTIIRNGRAGTPTPLKITNEMTNANRGYKSIC